MWSSVVASPIKTTFRKETSFLLRKTKPDLSVAPETFHFRRQLLSRKQHTYPKSKRQEGSDWEESGRVAAYWIFVLVLLLIKFLNIVSNSILLDHLIAFQNLTSNMAFSSFWAKMINFNHGAHNTIVMQMA